jgi:hypothetical protein
MPWTIPGRTVCRRRSIHGFLSRSRDTRGASGFRIVFVPKARQSKSIARCPATGPGRGWEGIYRAGEKIWVFAVLLAERGPEHLYRPRRSGTTTKNKARRAAKARADLVVSRNSKAYTAARSAIRSTIILHAAYAGHHPPTCSRAPLPTSPASST